MPLSGGQLTTYPAGVSPMSSGSLASATLTWARCSSRGAYTDGDARGLPGALSPGDAGLVVLNRKADGKVLAVAGSGARRPSHDTTGRYSTVSPDQNVGNVARKYCVLAGKSLATSGAETVSTPRPSTR